MRPSAAKPRQSDLFGAAPATDAAMRPPLAERMRPQHIDELAGQHKWLSDNGFLRQALAADRLPSMVLWGPPGVGKTTLARLVTQHSRAHFAPLSAVLDGVQQLRELIGQAQAARQAGQKTVLFVDEIHRWGRAQQDALLPHVEAGTVTLIGATTENPGFSLTSALLSRCVLVTLAPLSEDDLHAVLLRALRDPRGYGTESLTVDDAVVAQLAVQADGDARRALTLLEAAVEPLLQQPVADGQPRHLGRDELARTPLQKGPRYDRQGDEHYHVISAFIKSMRGSDVDAALYWLARMLEAGEDPRFICRRLVIFAAEDVGNADPAALPLAVAAAQTHELCGLPESRIAMAHATTYLACAPKSKASYLGLDAALAVVQQRGSLPVPDHLRNGSSSVGRQLGWGRDYRDPHAEGGWSGQHHLPDALRGTNFYEPTRNGVEARIADRVALWRTLRHGGEGDS